MYGKQAVGMVTDLAGEAQFRLDDRRRPQNGMDIRREMDRRSRKATLMKNSDCNRRETQRFREPPRICSIRKETDESFGSQQQAFSEEIHWQRLTKVENQIGELANPMEMKNRRSGRRTELWKKARRRRPEGSPTSRCGGCKRTSILVSHPYDFNYKVLCTLKP
ncbi:LOW QUALITY PROTEIN: hypothetical protein HID58_053255 [Brassica napus]|uniref:Uncharacterized protein n=1 Tax=Brassica napus TaxID=3708 RepID=A0ABQ8AFF0_BRANA|nr:LOW QUALITY PROTEIN: hypothetical protein HID58_053255 [Brassica napus]